MPPMLSEQREQQQARTAYAARWTHERTVLLDVPWRKKYKLPVRGDCYGPFAVHPTVHQTMPIPEGTPRFTLTHLPSGKVVLYSNREGDLRRIAEHLTKVAAAAFACDTVEEIQPLLSDEIYNWLRDCYRCGGWIDPKLTPLARRAAVEQKRLEARKK